LEIYSWESEAYLSIHAQRIDPHKKPASLFNLKSKGFLIWLITIGLKKPLITIGIKKKHEILNKKK